jgi:hypothetical protein
MSLASMASAGQRPGRGHTSMERLHGVGWSRRVAVAAVGSVLIWLLLLGAAVPRVWADGSCPNEEFRVGPAAALPDCRAYEMVSPPDKNGGGVDGGILFGETTPPAQAAANGEAVTYASTTAFAGLQTESALVASQYLSTRTSNGWVTREITPTQKEPEGRLPTVIGTPEWSLFQGFGENLEDAFLLAWNPQPDPEAPAGFFNPYVRNDATGEYQLLSSVVPAARTPREEVDWNSGFRPIYAGMSTNGEHVIFEVEEALAPGAVPRKSNLYEWSAGRPLELVSVPESVGSGEPRFGSYTHGPAAVILSNGGADGGFPWNFSGALSSDGKRAFWTGGNGQVYMHELTEEGSRTVDVSASQKSGSTSGEAKYWTANPSGSLVYFTSGSQLTSDSTAGAGEDLYQYDAETGQLSDLTVDDGAGETAAVKGVLGVGESEGSAYVYFVAGGVLASNTNGNGEKARPQGYNLYVYHGGVTTYIATLANGAEWERSDYTEAVMARTSRVSPSGELLAFQSRVPLTGYDNMPASGEGCPTPSEHNQREGSVLAYRNNGDGGCAEVFEYDAQTARLVCASCSPSGQPPTAYSVVPESLHVWENVPGWQSTTDQQRYLLDDGRLFFQSEDALLAQATNGQQNIYEYEPEGVGQCGAADWNGGCLYLISTGTSGNYSYFLDASADGRDVFILTSQQLVPQDGDEAIDVYDAREDGGFPLVAPASCSGEACKPAATPAPAIYGAPASAIFQGPENGMSLSKPTVRQSGKNRTKAKSKQEKRRKARAGHKTTKKLTPRRASAAAGGRDGGDR